MGLWQRTSSRCTLPIKVTGGTAERTARSLGTTARQPPSQPVPCRAGVLRAALQPGLQAEPCAASPPGTQDPPLRHRGAPSSGEAAVTPRRNRVAQSAHATGKRLWFHVSPYHHSDPGSRRLASPGHGLTPGPFSFVFTRKEQAGATAYKLCLCLWGRHLVWAAVRIPTALLPIQLSESGFKKQQRMDQDLGPLYARGRPGRPWLQLSSFVTKRGVNQCMQALSLLLLCNFAFQVTINKSLKNTYFFI